MIEKEKLEGYAKKLMFEMNSDEYETLQKEFEVIMDQLSLIDKIKGIKEAEPMTYPYITYEAVLRNDDIEESLSVDDVLQNAKNTYLDQVKVPKVVE